MTIPDDVSRPARAEGQRGLGPIGVVWARLPRGRGVLVVAVAIAVAIVAGVVLGRALASETAAPATPPDLVLRRQLPHLLTTLDHARVSGRAALADARTADGQERAAGALARAHLEAAAALRPAPGAQARALAGDLAAAARAYSELGRAAQAGSQARFVAARDAVSRAEAGIRRTLPAAGVAAATPAAAGPSRLALVVVMVVFGSLGAVLSLLRLPERIVAAARTETPDRLGAPRPATSTPRPRRTARPARTRATSTPRPSRTAPAPTRAAAARAAPAEPKPAATAAPARRPPARHGTRPARRRPRTVPAPFPPGTGWSCEITWHASLRSAGFRATAKAPGQPERLIAESPGVSWPPLLPPLPDEDVLAAARTLARALRNAGWTAVSRGENWYAQRFVWRAADDPQPLGD